MLPDWLLFVFGLILTIGTGFFVASEFSLVNLDRADLESRQRRGESMLALPIRAIRETSTHLSSAQLGITLTTLLAGYTFEPAIGHWIEPLVLDVGLPRSASGPISTVVAVLVATLLSMIFGELVPKNLALSVPVPTVKVVAPFQIGFTLVFRPFVWVLNSTANAMLRIVGIEPREELSSARTAEELRSLVRRSAREGSLDRDTATLLSRTLVFADHDASDAMTPRPRVAAIEGTQTAADIVRLAGRTGFSRFPVMGEDIDDVTGIVHLKQAVSVPRERRASVPATALQTEPLRVPETIKLDSLLGELRGRGFQMAVVVDEYGGTAGVVTLEDLVEELVGEVADEHDRSRADVVRSRDWLTFPGALRPDELLDRAGVTVPEDGPYETVAGWLMSELGRMPRVGDSIAIVDGTFRVERMDGRRVDRIRFTPAPVAVDGAEASR